jgi:hypothetical protein
MSKLTKLTLLCALTGCGAAVHLQAQEAVPTAESILDRYVEVTGGKAAYEKHSTQIITGNIAVPEQGLTGRLTRYAMAPDKEYSVVEFGPIGKIESGVFGGVAWEKSAVLGPRVKSGDEKEQAIREARFNAPIEWRRTFPKVDFSGKKMVNGEECYEITLTPATGKPETQCFSIKSGLLLKTATIAVSPMGEVAAESEVFDYKKFGGVLYPARSKEKAGTQELDVIVTSIKFDEPIPPQYFELPPEIKAVLGKNSRK